MKYLRKLAFAMMILVSSPVIYASDSPAWVSGSKIVKISVQPNGNVYITIDTNVPNLGCPYYHGGILQLDTSAPNFDQQYSLAIAAFMAEKNVDIYVSGCGDAYPYAQNTNVSH